MLKPEYIEILDTIKFKGMSWQAKSYENYFLKKHESMKYITIPSNLCLSNLPFFVLI